MSMRTGRAIYSTARRSFFNSSKQTSLRALAENLLAAKNAQTIHANYPAFINSYVDSETSVSPLSKTQFSNILRLLARSSRPGDIERMKEMVKHIHDIFQFAPDHEFQLDIIRAFAQSGQVDNLLIWLGGMASLPGCKPPSLVHFHTAFMDLQNYGASFSTLRHFVQSMRVTTPIPTAETFILLIRARWIIARDSENGALPEPFVFLSLIKDMKGLHIPYQEEILHVLCDGYREAGNESMASTVHNAYVDSCTAPRNRRLEQLLRWEAELTQVAYSGGIDAAIVAFQRLHKQGCQLSSRIAHAMLRYSRSLDDLRSLETTLNFSPGPPHWFLIVNNNLLANHIDHASKVYEEAKKAGIVPEPGLLIRFATKLCLPETGKPSNSAITAALALYRDVLLAPPKPSSTHFDALDRSPSFYRILMRGISTCPSPAQFVDVVKSMREEMENSKMLSDSTLTTSLIIFLMRTAKDMDLAFERYSELRVHLNANGYQAILSAFCSLDIGPIPANLYFSIARHMKDAGYPCTSKVYTIYLRQIATISQLVTHPEALVQMTEETRRAHNLLKLDSQVTPDAPLYNQLMDTYQRLGDIDSCINLWDSMFSSGRYSNASVSIIFDACGYAMQPEKLFRIRKRLLEDNFPWNDRNWHSFVEALCNMGLLSEAARFVCLEMGKGTIPAPSIQLARYTLRMFPKREHRIEVSNLLEEHHPHLLEDEKFRSTIERIRRNVDTVPVDEESLNWID